MKMMTKKMPATRKRKIKLRTKKAKLIKTMLRKPTKKMVCRNNQLKGRKRRLSLLICPNLMKNQLRSWSCSWLTYSRQA